MIDTIIQEFHYTSQFFAHRFGTNLEGEVGQQLLHDLLDHLQFDGYDLRNNYYCQDHHHSAEGVFGFGLHRLLQSSDDSSSTLTLNLILSFFCVLCAGLASGLTQGLLSLDVLEMTVKSQSGTPKEKEYATKLLPIIKPHHLLLVTLMLWNACATEALPIFLNAIVPEYVAIIISVTLVLMFGEIIPASILTGPRQLQITASLAPLVYLVYFILFPLAYPISKLLDFLVGHEEGLTLYNKGEIATMMRMQHEEAVRRARSGETLRDTVHNEEVLIIGGALKFRDMKVSDVMTPLDQIFMLNIDEALSYKTIYEIFKAGYSRIPIYGKDKNDIIGLLLAKDLIFVDPEDETPIRNFVEFFARKPVMVWHDELLGETLTTFRRERGHLGMVRDVFVEGENDPYYIVVGIITLEDIIEEILGTEIEDEFDADHDETIPPHQMNKYNLRDMDLARLKSLRSKVTDDKLSTDEIEAITTFLPKQIPDLLDALTRKKVFLKDLVLDAQVFVLKRQTPEGEFHPVHNDILVRKGRITNTCILILQGKVRIIHNDKTSEASSSKIVMKESKEVESFAEGRGMEGGRGGQEKEEEHIEVTNIEHEEVVGPWTIICAEALKVAENTYIPNFTACIHSTDLRIVRIANYYHPPPPPPTPPGATPKLMSAKSRRELIRGGSRTEFPVVASPQSGLIGSLVSYSPAAMSDD